MRTVPLFASLILGSSLLAQSPVPKMTVEPDQVIVLQPNGSRNCPVQLSARHARDTGMVRVSPRSAPPGQGYSVTFRPLNWRSVEQATVTLHGLAGAQVVPVRDHPSGDATETFTVSPSTEPDHLWHSVVYVHKLTGVQWIELDELTFTDGTKWHRTADSFCRVAPNGFMLVTAAQ